MVYVGNFLHATDQEQVQEADRRYGDFSLIVEAPDHRSALLLFRERIVEFRKTRDFFKGRCRIYCTQIIEFEELPRAKPMMLTFRSVAGDPVMPFIGCAIPTSESDGCRIYEWEGTQPEIDGNREEPFLDFHD